jgi:dihydrofolate reductase|tara:strand:- start:1143 stop:1631 length:489 start_codon:yes stop_codon:yes gene_type:complete
MIAAMSTNRVIGINNDLPWHLPHDFKFFQTKTQGHHVLMGRKNYESLPPKFRPLPNRINLIITKNKNYEAENTHIFHSLENAIEYAKSQGEHELFIIGGGEVYKLALPYADTIYLTEVHTSIEGHAYFPVFDKQIFKETLRSHHTADERHLYNFDYVTYQKK